ncbi:GGDEF domain-containing protein [Marinobacter hydrocarbonoclasticus]|nr:GGDEF domain-containing protein [Marinobacter nauticus]
MTSRAAVFFDHLSSRLSLTALVGLAFLLDISASPDAFGPLLYAAVLVACLYLRDRLALLILGLASVALMLVAAGMDPTQTLGESLAGQRGSTIGTLLLVALPGAQVLRRWERQQRRLTAQAQTDPLTGLANRRQLDQHLSRAWHQARRHNQNLAVLMLDLDHFKHLNDTLGHLEGDALLLRFAALLGEACRGSDVAGRFGGEEFMLICPNTDGPGALTLAERIRGRWQAHTADLPEAQTVSIGIAILGPEQSDPQSLVANADAALYCAKSQGRNRSQLGLPLHLARPTKVEPVQALKATEAQTAPPLRSV